MKRDLLERDISVEVDWNAQAPVGKATVTEEDGHVTIEIKLSDQHADRVVDLLTTQRAVGMAFCILGLPSDSANLQIRRDDE